MSRSEINTVVPQFFVHKFPLILIKNVFYNMIWLDAIIHNLFSGFLTSAVEFYLGIARIFGQLIKSITNIFEWCNNFPSIQTVTFRKFNRTYEWCFYESVASSHTFQVSSSILNKHIIQVLDQKMLPRMQLGCHTPKLSNIFELLTPTH